MKKRALMLGAILCILGLAIMGCPKTNINVTTEQTADAVSIIKQAIESLGYKVKVEAKDVNKNGTVDFYVTYMSGNENDPNNDLLFLGGTTGAVGAMKGQLEYQIDMAYAKYGSKVYKATSADCAKCVAMIDRGATDEEIGACGLSIWTEMGK